MNCNICGRESDGKLCWNCIEMTKQCAVAVCVKCGEIAMIYFDSENPKMLTFTTKCPNCSNIDRVQNLYELEEHAIDVMKKEEGRI